MKLLSVVVALLVACVPVLASHPPATWYYSDAADYRDARATARAYQFDALDEDDVDIEDYQCFSLDDYNVLADRNRYDGVKRLESANIRKSDLRRLDRDDYNRIADEDAYDGITRDDVDDYKDARCWDLRDYNRFADTDRADKWKRIDFQSRDDVEKIQRIGTSRYGFFGAGDFDRATLQYQHPTRYVPQEGSYQETYLVRDLPGRYYLPYGEVNVRTIETR